MFDLRKRLGRIACSEKQKEQDKIYTIILKVKPFSLFIATVLYFFFSLKKLLGFPILARLKRRDINKTP